MKAIIKKSLSMLCSMVLVFSLFCSTVVAAEEHPQTSHRVHYTIYDKNGNIKSTGYLPMSEEEAVTRSKDYGPVTIYNGDEATFDNDGEDFWATYNVSAKYSCGFPDPQVLPIIVVDRYLDYFTTIMEDRLWQVLAKPVFRWRNRSGLSMNADRAA